MTWQVIAALVGAALYGLTYLVAGFLQLRNRKLETWTGMLLSLCGALVAFSGVLTALKASNAPWVLLIGLLGIHAVTLSNGMKLHGKLTWSHHLVRAAVSLGLLGLTFWGR